PPLFPFLSELLYRLSGGQQHIFTYLLIFILLLADAGNLYFFQRLASRYWEGEEFTFRVLFYLVILVALPYSWWYFDSLAVLTLLAGLTFAVEGHPGRAGVWWGIGALVKFFPLIGLASLFEWRRFGRLLRCTAIALGIFILGMAALWLVSPQYTQASLQSQSGKGSWETIWALVDGNFSTGNFGPLVQRLDPALASQPVGNLARISPWLTLPLFALLGVSLLVKAKPSSRQPLVALGLAMSLFFLWSPGWSVQWVLYLLPILLLGLERRHLGLMTALFVLVNLLEWPILLSRGQFDLLPLTVLIRTLLFVLSAILFGSLLLKQRRAGGDPSVAIQPAAPGADGEG
ncbi:DUF2029 domain-containing protein, partial [bacterium]